MRVAAIALVLVLAACGGSDGFSDDYPVRPGGGGIGGVTNGHPPDAAPPADSDGSTPGKVCVISDLRRWTNGCSTTMAGGLTVTMGTATAITAANGNFSIIPSPTTTMIQVDGPGIETSINPYTPGLTFYSAIAPTTAAWNLVQGATGFSVTDGDGSAIIELLDDGTEASGIIADSAPAPAAGQEYYDNAGNKDTWSIDSTDGDSKVMFPDLPPGSVSVTATIGTVRMGSRSFPVVADAITFGSLNVP